MIRVEEDKIGKQDIVSVYVDHAIPTSLSVIYNMNEEWDNLSSTDNPFSFRLISAHVIVNSFKYDDDLGIETQGNWDNYVAVGNKPYSVTNMPYDVTAKGSRLSRRVRKGFKNETILAAQELVVGESEIFQKPIISESIYIGYTTYGNLNETQDFKGVFRFERKKVTENVYLKALVSGC